MGAATPGIFWIITSISTNHFIAACSIKSLIEERFDPAVGRCNQCPYVGLVHNRVWTCRLANQVSDQRHGSIG